MPLTVFKLLAAIVACLCFPATAGDSLHSSSFSGTSIYLSDLDVVGEDIRESANAIYRRFAVRTFSWDGLTTVEDLSSIAAPLSEANRDLFLKNFAHRSGSSDGEKYPSTLSALTLSPFEPLVVGLSRPLESQSVILLVVSKPQVLRHELLHVLFNLATQPELKTIEGRLVSKLEWLYNDTVQHAQKVDSAYAIWKATPQKDSLLEWAAATAALDVARVRQRLYSTVRELEVLEVELLHREKLNLSRFLVDERVLYFGTEIHRIAELESQILAAEPYTRMEAASLSIEEKKSWARALTGLQELFRQCDLVVKTARRVLRDSRLDSVLERYGLVISKK
jgi:hypothetical protein